MLDLEVINHSSLLSDTTTILIMELLSSGVIYFTYCLNKVLYESNLLSNVLFINVISKVVLSKVIISKFDKSSHYK
jgi:hypothetical protein